MKRHQNNKAKITEKFNDRRKLVFKTNIFPKIDRHETDIYIHTREGDRLDNLAYFYYKDVKLWWIIAQVNHIGKGTMHLPPATLIRVPTIDRVFEVLNELKQIQISRL